MRRPAGWVHRGVSSGRPVCAIGRIAAVLVLAAVAGCDIVTLGPAVPPGGRAWIVTVENQSPRPATLVVAEDRGSMGDVVGTASPSVVPPGTTVEVVFGVPGTGGWAIFVNPGPMGGALVSSTDVPREASGRMPFKIVVNPDGGPAADVPDLKGWFGN